MNKLILTLALAVSAMVMADVSQTNDTDSVSEDKKPSVLQRVGGFVIDYKAAKGKYLFVDCQKRLDTKLVRGIANGLKGDFSWNVECAEGSQSISSTKQAIAEKNRLDALAATFFVDSDTLPLLTVAPESNVSVINVRELVADNPKSILVENRLVREAMRAFAFSLGSGYSTFEAGVMQPISAAADLDRFSANFMPPDSANAALQNGTKIGFKPFRRTTYKRACKEGWAPPPTNDFQKAVWDHVHALPTEPIKIKPETQKQDK